MSRIVSALALVTAAALFHSKNATAADINWSGYYRIEAVDIHGPELNSAQNQKAYFLHHMVLSPKIVAGDGLTIYGRFDLLNNSGFGQNNQLGEFFGAGPRNDNSFDVGNYVPKSNSRHAGNSNVLSRAQASGTVAVTQLYGVWNQEFGSVIVGRVPMQFGLGVVHNAGTGAFDHYFESKDIVAYKAVLGNIFVMPMIGKVSEGDLGNEDDVNDYMVHVQYDNPETDLTLGVFFEQRVGTSAGNDIPISGSSAVGATAPNGFKSQLFSVFVKQRAGNFHIGVEGDFLSGDTGAQTASGQNVSANGFGLAADVSYKPEDSRFSAGVKLGLASGDDPNTADTNEGFSFNRNYDVAFLLFNHPMGQYDVLRTGLVRGTTIPASSQPDTEALSNALFFAPNVDFKLRDNLLLNGTIAYAMLNKEPVVNGSTDKSLGFEVDVGVTYKPFERLTWKSQLGALIPGGAWRGSGIQTYENRVAYGFETKAAISF